MHNASDRPADIFGRKDIVDTPACYRAFGHIRLRGCLKLLRDGNAPKFPYVAKCRRAIAIIAGDDDGYELPAPMVAQGSKKNGYHVRPSPRLRERLQAESPVKNMQIALRRDDEHVIGAEDQSFRDQFNRHFGGKREDLVELGGYISQVINNDDRNTRSARMCGSNRV